MGLLLSRLADRCLGFDSFMSLTCGANSVVNGPKLALKSLLISPRHEQRIMAKLRLNREPKLSRVWLSSAETNKCKQNS